MRILVNMSGIQQQSRSACSGTVMAMVGLFVVGGVGFVLGGFVGFLLRPSAAFIGQLPFVTVITRGAYLTGLDRLLVPTAETSFNYMVSGAVLVGMIGAVLGAICGFVVSFLSSKKNG